MNAHDLAIFATLVPIIVAVIQTFIFVRFKASVESEYAIKLETFKGEIRRDADREIEQLRGNLQMVVAQSNFRYSHVFERTANAIEAIYAKLLAVEESAANYRQLIVSEDDPDKKTASEALKR